MDGSCCFGRLALLYRLFCRYSSPFVLLDYSIGLVWRWWVTPPTISSSIPCPFPDLIAVFRCFCTHAPFLYALRPRGAALRICAGRPHTCRILRNTLRTTHAHCILFTLYIFCYCQLRLYTCVWYCIALRMRGARAGHAHACRFGSICRAMGSSYCLWFLHLALVVVCATQARIFFFMPPFFSILCGAFLVWHFWEDRRTGGWTDGTFLPCVRHMSCVQQGGLRTGATCSSALCCLLLTYYRFGCRFHACSTHRTVAGVGALRHAFLAALLVARWQLA